MLMDRGWFLDAFTTPADSAFLAVGRVHSFDVVESGQETLTLAVLSNYFTNSQEKLFFKNKSTMFHVGSHMSFEYETYEKESYLQQIWGDINGESLMGKGNLAPMVDEVVKDMLSEKMSRGDMDLRVDRSIAEAHVMSMNEETVRLLRKTASLSNMSRAVRKLGFDRYRRAIKDTAILRGWKALYDQKIFQEAQAKRMEPNFRDVTAEIALAGLPKHPIVMKLREWLSAEFKDDLHDRNAYLTALIISRQHIETLLCAPSYDIFMMHLYETIFSSTFARKVRLLQDQGKITRDIHEPRVATIEERIDFFVLYLIDRYAAKKFKKASIQEARTVTNLEYLATCKPRELYDILKESVAKSPRQQDAQAGAGSNIGKFKESKTVGVNNRGKLRGVIEHIETNDRIDLATIEQRRATVEEFQYFIGGVQALAQDLPDSGEKKLVQKVIDLFKAHPPKYFILTREGKRGFFGMARPDLLVIDEDITRGTIAIFHEMAEYVAQAHTGIAKEMEALLTTESSLWLQRSGNDHWGRAQFDYFRLNYCHYVIRAFTRQVFGPRDEALSDVIKVKQGKPGMAVVEKFKRGSRVKICKWVAETDVTLKKDRPMETELERDIELGKCVIFKGGATTLVRKITPKDGMTLEVRTENSIYEIMLIPESGDRKREGPAGRATPQDILKTTRFKGKSVKNMTLWELEYIGNLIREILNINHAAIEVTQGWNQPIPQHVIDRIKALQSDADAIKAELKLRSGAIVEALARCIPQDKAPSADDLDNLNQTMRRTIDFLWEGKQYEKAQHAVIYIRDCITEAAIGTIETRLTEASLYGVLGAEAMGKIRPIEARPLQVVIQCAPIEIVSWGINKTGEAARKLREGYGINAKSIIGTPDALEEMVLSAVAAMGTDPNARAFLYLPADMEVKYKLMVARTPALGDRRVRVQLVDDPYAVFLDLTTRFELGLNLLDYDRMSAEERMTPPQELLNLLAAVTDYNPVVILQRIFADGFVLKMRKHNYRDREEWKLAQDIVRRAL
jgi:uncharacterized protein YodC (DUF2158 family)